jgi:hypothetical protein
MLHELAEKLDDRPWAREQADASHLSGSVLRYEDGDLSSCLFILLDWIQLKG